MNGFHNLEKQEIETSVRRIQYLLDSEIDYLGKLTNDWVTCGDTYAFIHDHSQKNIE